MRSSDRLLGVDVAKVVAMFFVVAVHVAGYGLQATTFGGKVPHALSYPLFMTCINIFGIASGYVGVHNDISLRRMLKLWFQVVSTGLFVLGAVRVFTDLQISAQDWCYACFPVSTSQYWYITAYFMLLLVMPILNAGLKAMDWSRIRVCVRYFFACICCLSLVVPGKVLALNNGYSFGWLVVLYIFGGCLRLHPPKMPSRPVQVSFAVISLLLMCVGYLVSEELRIPFLSRTAISAYQYTSPFVLGISVIVFMALSKVRTCSALVARPVAFLSITSLGVYLFHCQPVLANLQRVHKGFVRADSAVEWLGLLVGLTLFVYISCTVFEYIRRELTRSVAMFAKLIYKRLPLQFK